jgi:hypothetical protein
MAHPAGPTQSMHSLNYASVVTTAVHVISMERAALANLERIYKTNEWVQQNLARAVTEIIHSIKNGGKLVICGVGKSGKIGQKVVATMISMGIHSAFLHPTEALHGDLGLIRLVGVSQALMWHKGTKKNPRRGWHSC